jgi:hypothetical protein
MATYCHVPEQEYSERNYEEGNGKHPSELLILAGFELGTRRILARSVTSTLRTRQSSEGCRTEWEYTENAH